MRSHLLLFLLSAVVVAATASPSWADIFTPGVYTHHPETGQPVNQFARKAPALKYEDPTYRRGGYVSRNYRTQLPGGGSEYRRSYDAWGAAPTGWGYWPRYAEGGPYWGAPAGRGYGYHSGPVFYSTPRVPYARR